mmetsp:Transcript_20429/g.52318  ORF Transcript_20429/g.52318 Transcript_20429/m.52318 type:complete len:225 (+) Transcript_20429:383-1057(+)
MRASAGPPGEWARARGDASRPAQAASRWAATAGGQPRQRWAVRCRSCRQPCPGGRRRWHLAEADRGLAGSEAVAPPAPPPLRPHPPAMPAPAVLQWPPRTLSAPHAQIGRPAPPASCPRPQSAARTQPPGGWQSRSRAGAAAQSRPLAAPAVQTEYHGPAPAGHRTRAPPGSRGSSRRTEHSATPPCSPHKAAPAPERRAQPAPQRHAPCAHRNRLLLPPLWQS